MPLPKIDLPIYELVLPSTGKKIKYRPFTVKEEKILLMAQESKKLNESIEAVKQVVNNCLLDDDISNFAMFDLEYILLLLRSKSVDNNVKFAIKDPDTGETVELELDLNDVKVRIPEGHTNIVDIDGNHKLFLNYPSIDQFIDFVEIGENEQLKYYNIMISCLDKLVAGDEVYKFRDFGITEIDEFMDGLSSEVLMDIRNFFDNMPKLRHEMKYKNNQGKEQTFVLEGMESFFI